MLGFVIHKYIKQQITFPKGTERSETNVNVRINLNTVMFLKETEQSETHIVRIN